MSFVPEGSEVVMRFVVSFLLLRGSIIVYCSIVVGEEGVGGVRI